PRRADRRRHVPDPHQRVLGAAALRAPRAPQRRALAAGLRYPRRGAGTARARPARRPHLRDGVALAGGVRVRVDARRLGPSPRAATRDASAPGYTRVACPAQYGSRSRRLTSLPAVSRGKSSWNDTWRGAL